MTKTKDMAAPADADGFRPYAGAVGAETLQEVEEWLEGQAAFARRNLGARETLKEFRFRFGTYHPDIEVEL